MVKRIFLIIPMFLCLVAFCTVLLGCSQDNNNTSTLTYSGGSTDENTLTIMGNDSNLENIYIDRIFDLYEKKTENKLNIIPIDNTEYENEVMAAIDRDDCPDIIMLFNNSLVSKIGGSEAIRDLSDQEWVNDLTQPSIDYVSGDNGEIMGLPFWESSVSGVYYNKKIFEDLGLKPATNQDEFNQLCDALVAAGITPIALGNEGCYGVYQFGLDPIVADNPDILKKLNNGELKYSDIPEVRAMLEWLKKAYDSGWFGNTADIHYKDWSSTIANGDAAMLFTWNTWFDTDFSPGEYAKDDFGVMPFFLGTTNEGSYEGGNLNMFTVNLNSDKQDMALDFIEFCADPDNYNIAFNGVATESVFEGEVTNIESPMLKEMQSSIDEKERTSTAEPKIKNYNARAFNDAVHKMYNNEMTIDEVLAVMDATLNE